MLAVIQIDVGFANKWKMTAEEAVIYSTLRECHSWAKQVVVGGSIFYRVTPQKLNSMNPIINKHSFFRVIRSLEGAGLIRLFRENDEFLIRLADDAKGWMRQS